MKKNIRKNILRNIKNFLSDVYKCIQKDTSGMKWFKQLSSHLTHSWRRSLLYRNKSTVLHSKSMDWFLYDTDFLNERVNSLEHYIQLAVLNGTLKNSLKCCRSGWSSCTLWKYTNADLKICQYLRIHICWSIIT